jgi:hypothetical protein
MAVTNFTIKVARTRAISELAAGITDGPGLASCRAWLAAVDAGRVPDPMLPVQIPPKPKVPFQLRPITNDLLDGRERQAQAGPARGTAGWFAARKRAKA